MLRRILISLVALAVLASSATLVRFGAAPVIAQGFNNWSPPAGPPTYAPSGTMMGTYQSSNPTALTTGTMYPPRIDQYGNLLVVTSPVSTSTVEGVDLQKVGGTPVALGQNTSANSIPVVLPNDQTVLIQSGSNVLGVRGVDNPGTNAGKALPIQGIPSGSAVGVGGIAGATNVGVVLSPGSTQPTSCSGKITGGSAFVLLAANATRQGFQLMNLLSNSNNMGFSYSSSTATIGTAGTYTLRPGDSYVTPPGFHPENNIYIVGTQNDSYSCDAW